MKLDNNVVSLLGLVCIHRLIDWNSFRVSSEFLNSEQKHIGMSDVQPYLEGIIPKLSRLVFDAINFPLGLAPLIDGTGMARAIPKPQ